MNCVVNFPPTWINADRFEATLRNSFGPHSPGSHEVIFYFPTGCKVMIDGATRLLSLVNQLAFSTRRVRLNFEEDEAGTMGYLNRMGFFDHLNSKVVIYPERPAYSGAVIHRGGNSMLEIARISKDFRDVDLPPQSLRQPFRRRRTAGCRLDNFCRAYRQHLLAIRRDAPMSSSR